VVKYLICQKQRVAMLLTYYEDYTNAEAAEYMNLNIKAVESLLVRARNKLKGKLKGLQL
jgi:RNA polymerase sigma-70 factor (ECF subfamily)